MNILLFTNHQAEEQHLLLHKPFRGFTMGHVRGKKQGKTVNKTHLDANLT